MSREMEEQAVKRKHRKTMVEETSVQAVRGPLVSLLKRRDYLLHSARNNPCSLIDSPFFLVWRCDGKRLDFPPILSQDDHVSRSIKSNKPFLKEEPLTLTLGAEISLEEEGVGVLSAVAHSLCDGSIKYVRKRSGGICIHGRFSVRGTILLAEYDDFVHSLSGQESWLKWSAIWSRYGKTEQECRKAGLRGTHSDARSTTSLQHSAVFWVPGWI